MKKLKCKFFKPWALVRVWWWNSVQGEWKKNYDTYTNEGFSKMVLNELREGNQLEITPLKD